MNNTLHTTLRARNTALDLIRIVAIAAVIMIHASADFIIDFPPGSFEYIWGNTFDSVSRLGVPLFVMTSGALLLDEEKPLPLREIFGKRIPHLLLLLFSWSLIYAVFFRIILPLTDGTPIDWQAFTNAFVFGHLHLWYLYMQIGLYLALPFLRAFVCRKNRHLVLLYLIITGLAQFSVPVLRALAAHWSVLTDAITFIGKFQLSFFNVYIAYYLMGWYIVHVGIQKWWCRLPVYFLSLASVLLIIWYVGLTGNRGNWYSNGGILVFLYSTGIFLAIYTLCKGHGTDRFATLSKCTFGMYAVHLLIFYGVDLLLPQTLPAPLYMLSAFTATFFLSFLFTWLFSMLPLLKKLVRA